MSLCSVRYYLVPFVICRVYFYSALGAYIDGFAAVVAHTFVIGATKVQNYFLALLRRLYIFFKHFFSLTQGQSG